jgi:alpha-tubulin suppressor-like RCC1 family protein
MGVGLEGQLGNGVKDGNGSPSTLVPVQGGLAFTQLAAGENHTCGITSSGAAYCWGYNGQGELGTTTAERCGAGTCSSVPVAVAGGHTFTQLDAEVNTTCGVTAGTGRVLCWGAGYGAAPVEVGAGRAYTQVAVGFDHVCALSGTQAYCRGVNTYGQLGTGGTNPESAFTPVAGGHAFAQVVAGQQYTCGLTTGGTALCWGRNSEGALGSGPLTSTPRPTPAPVSGGLSFTALSAGQAHACGRATDGRLYCWGNDSFGQVGDGVPGGNHVQPTRVIRQL